MGSASRLWGFSRVRTEHLGLCSKWTGLSAQRRLDPGSVLGLHISAAFCVHLQYSALSCVYAAWEPANWTREHAVGSAIVRSCWDPRVWFLPNCCRRVSIRAHRPLASLSKTGWRTATAIASAYATGPGWTSVQSGRMTWSIALWSVLEGFASRPASAECQNRRVVASQGLLLR